MVCFKPPNGQVFHWWGFQFGFEIFEIKFKETWNFAEYVEEKSWDNPTTFLTHLSISRYHLHFFSALDTRTPRTSLMLCYSYLGNGCWSVSAFSQILDNTEADQLYPNVNGIVNHKRPPPPPSNFPTWGFNKFNSFQYQIERFILFCELQIENYSSLLLGDPIVTLACNQHYQVNHIEFYIEIKIIFFHNKKNNQISLFLTSTTQGLSGPTTEKVFLLELKNNFQVGRIHDVSPIPPYNKEQKKKTFK